MSAAANPRHAVVAALPVGLSPLAVIVILLLAGIVTGCTSLPYSFSLAPMVERAAPAVVNIATESELNPPIHPLRDDPFFQRFFDLPQSPIARRTQALGSGVIIDAQAGHIVTNRHVVEQAYRITVTLQDGRRFEAELIGADPETDIAVVKIPAERLTAMPLAHAEQLRVGDFVVAIGNPFGLGQTVTVGIISALGRSGLGLEGYEDFIQTDASINPGSSGGALVNLRGELVGLNTAILAPSGVNVGINFAIPANIIQRLVDQLVRFGRIERGQLGVLVIDWVATETRSQGAPQRGAFIRHIEPNSTAAEAGLHIADVVVAVNERPIASAEALRNLIGLLAVGERLNMRILRNGQAMNIQAWLKARPL